MWLAAARCMPGRSTTPLNRDEKRRSLHNLIITHCRWAHPLCPKTLTRYLLKTTAYLIRTNGFGLHILRNICKTGSRRIAKKTRNTQLLQRKDKLISSYNQRLQKRTLRGKERRPETRMDYAYLNQGFDPCGMGPPGMEAPILSSCNIPPSYADLGRCGPIGQSPYGYNAMRPFQPTPAMSAASCGMMPARPRDHHVPPPMFATCKYRLFAVTIR